MLKEGEVLEYAPEGTVLVKCKRIGDKEFIKAPNGLDWVMIKKSISKPSDTDKMALMRFVGFDEMKLESFIAFYKNATMRHISIPATGFQYSLIAGADKDDRPIYTSDNTYMYLVETIARSDPRNTISGHYLTLYEGDNITSVDLMTDDFFKLISQEFMKLKVNYAEPLPEKASPGINTHKNKLINAVSLMETICHVDESDSFDMRCTVQGGAMYYDTLGPVVFKVIPDGIELVPPPSGLLRRGDMAPIPVDEVDLSASPKDFRLIENLYNMDQVDRFLMSAWLLTTMMPRVDNDVSLLMPVVLNEGEQGSAKTAGHQNAIFIINPYITPTDIVVKANFNKEENLALRLSSHRHTLFDNAPPLMPESASTTLCVATTGGNDSKRQLYSNNTEFRIPLTGTAIITALTMRGIKPDLEERMLRVMNRAFTPDDAPRCPDDNRRIDRHDMDQYVAKNKAKIRGAALKIIQLVLAKFHERRRLTESIGVIGRLTDFATIGDIMMESYGYAPGTFIAMYKEVMEDFMQNRVDSDEIAQKIISKINENRQCVNNEIDEWFDWSVGVRKTMKEWVEFFGIMYENHAYTPRALSNAFATKRRVLLEAGIKVSEPLHTRDGNFVTITCIGVKKLDKRSIIEHVLKITPKLPSVHDQLGISVPDAFNKDSLFVELDQV